MKQKQVLSKLIMAWVLLVLLPIIAQGQGKIEDYKRADELRNLTRGKSYLLQLDPQWLEDNSRFWYQATTREGKKFMLVDVKQKKNAEWFDHVKFAAALSKAAEKEYPANNLPMQGPSIKIIDKGQAIQFTVEGVIWQADLSNYEMKKIGQEPPPPPGQQQRQGRGQPPQQRQGPPQQQGERGRSPDGKWQVVTKDNNLYLKSIDEDKEYRLSQDGEENNSYPVNNVSWSPDAKKIVAYRTSPADNKEVYLIQSSPPGGGRAILQKRVYELPGDKFTGYEMRIYDVATKAEIKANTEPIDFGSPRIRWHKDNRTFTLERTDRGHQRYRVIEVDATTGKTRSIIDEKTETFIGASGVRYLGDDDQELIWTSEKDGWKHLYLVDRSTGTIKNQITKGEWVVRGIDLVDEKNRQIWFQASGMNKGQDPYLIHFYRINFDGTGLLALTQGNGNHAALKYSPNREYYVDTYSRVDMPPVHELHASSDGKLIMELGKADITDLLKTGVPQSEVLVAKGRDDKTDIWGIICRPMNLDPAKKYPVVEYIYAGPHGSFTPKTFSELQSIQSLTELGFIVIQCDGMGTNNRSKAFHDVCWHNIKDSGFPDRIKWMQAAAKKYPYMDITRVGIYGTSAGGQNAMSAVLFHPEFYKVAVANCGCHDNRMDKASWNEQWMGSVIGPWYAESSNVDNAYRLQGKLQLVVGEMDTNVPPESTYRVVDALIKASKDFELVVVPGGGHGASSPITERKKRDFLVKNLLGVDPPNWNSMVKK